MRPRKILIPGAATGTLSRVAHASGLLAAKAGGTVMIAGRRYEVGSFHETGWRGDPLQTRILK
jgi:hypothetical protein